MSGLRRSADKMKKQTTTVIAVTITWVSLTCAILVVDYLGIHVPSLKSLAFDVLIYWYGLSEIISMLAFWVAVHWIPQRKVSIPSVVLVIGLTSMWWLATFILLMQTHGAMGGSY